MHLPQTNYIHAKAAQVLNFNFKTIFEPSPRRHALYVVHSIFLYLITVLDFSFLVVHALTNPLIWISSPQQKCNSEIYDINHIYHRNYYTVFKLRIYIEFQTRIVLVSIVNWFGVSLSLILILL